MLWSRNDRHGALNELWMPLRRSVPELSHVPLVRCKELGRDDKVQAQSLLLPGMQEFSQSSFGTDGDASVEGQLLDTI